MNHTMSFQTPFHGSKTVFQAARKGHLVRYANELHGWESVKVVVAADSHPTVQMNINIRSKLLLRQLSSSIANG